MIPVDFRLVCGHFRHQSRHSLASLGDLHNLSRGNPSKDACVVVSEISDSSSLHGATNVEHIGETVNGKEALMAKG